MEAPMANVAELARKFRRLYFIRSEVTIKVVGITGTTKKPLAAARGLD
jgi:hypothetical protein